MKQDAAKLFYVEPKACNWAGLSKSNPTQARSNIMLVLRKLSSGSELTKSLSSYILCLTLAIPFMDVSFDQWPTPSASSQMAQVSSPPPHYLDSRSLYIDCQWWWWCTIYLPPTNAIDVEPCVLSSGWLCGLKSGICWMSKCKHHNPICYILPRIARATTYWLG